MNKILKSAIVALCFISLPTEGMDCLNRFCTGAKYFYNILRYGQPNVDVVNQEEVSRILSEGNRYEIFNKGRELINTFDTFTQLAADNSDLEDFLHQTGAANLFSRLPLGSLDYSQDSDEDVNDFNRLALPNFELSEDYSDNGFYNNSQLKVIHRIDENDNNGIKHRQYKHKTNHNSISKNSNRKLNYASQASSLLKHWFGKNIKSDSNNAFIIPDSLHKAGFIVEIGTNQNKQHFVFINNTKGEPWSIKSSLNGEFVTFYFRYAQVQGKQLNKSVDVDNFLRFFNLSTSNSLRLIFKGNFPVNLSVNFSKQNIRLKKNAQIGFFTESDNNSKIKISVKEKQRNKAVKVGQFISFDRL